MVGDNMNIWYDFLRLFRPSIWHKCAYCGESFPILLMLNKHYISCPSLIDRKMIEFKKTYLKEINHARKM